MVITSRLLWKCREDLDKQVFWGLRVASTKLLLWHKHTWLIVISWTLCRITIFWCLHHSTHGKTESTPVQIFYPNRFKNDCPSGKPKLFNVEANSKINFVCPNVATMMDSTLREVTKANRYENLWLVHNSAAFDGCNVMQDPRHFILMRCEDPTSLQFRTVIFQRYSAEHHLTFQKGKSYFFICKFQNN